MYLAVRRVYVLMPCIYWLSLKKSKYKQENSSFYNTFNQPISSQRQIERISNKYTQSLELSYSKELC